MGENGDQEMGMIVSPEMGLKVLLAAKDAIYAAFPAELGDSAGSAIPTVIVGYKNALSRIATLTSECNSWRWTAEGPVGEKIDLEAKLEDLHRGGYPAWAYPKGTCSCRQSPCICSDPMPPVNEMFTGLKAELESANKWRGLAGCNSFEEMHATVGMLSEAQSRIKGLRRVHAELRELVESEHAEVERLKKRGVRCSCCGSYFAEPGEHDCPETEVIVAQDLRVEKLTTAIRWALGEDPDGTPDFDDEHSEYWLRDGQGIRVLGFWWRTTLRKLAGMAGEGVRND